MTNNIQYEFFTDRDNQWYMTYCDTSSAEGIELEITLPDKLSLEDGSETTYNLYTSCFYGETKIKKLIIPRFVKKLASRVFERSTIQEIYFYTNLPPVIDSETFLGLNPECKIYVPLGAKNYFSSPKWVQGLGGQAKWDERVIETNDALETLNKVAPLSKYNNLNLEGVILDKKVEEIGQMAYMATPNLKSINIAGNSNITVEQDDDNKPLVILNTDKIAVLKRNSDFALDEGKVDEYWPNAGYDLELEGQSCIDAKKIDQLAFQSTTIGKDGDGIVIGDSITYISPYAFLNSNIPISFNTSAKYKEEAHCITCTDEKNNKQIIYAPKGITYSCQEVSELLTTVKSIPAYLFKDHVFDMGYLNIPPSVEYIGNNAFEGVSGLIGINIEEKREHDLEIGDYAFSTLEKETALDQSFLISLPQQPTSKILFGAYSFAGNKPIEISLYAPEDTSSEIITNLITDNVFYKSGKESGLNIKRIYCGNKTIVNTYSQDENWKIIFSKVDVEIGNIETDVAFLMIPYGTKEIPVSEYENNTFLRKVYIPDTVYSIGSRSFKGCTSLVEVEFLNPEKEGKLGIQHNAFEGCTNLYTITLPARLNHIHNGGFKDCLKLVQIISYVESVAHAPNATPVSLYDTYMTPATFDKKSDSPGNIFSNCPSPKCLIKKYGSHNDSPYLKYWTDSDDILTVYFQAKDLEIDDKKHYINSNIGIYTKNIEGKYNITQEFNYGNFEDYIIIYQEEKRIKNSNGTIGHYYLIEFPVPSDTENGFLSGKENKKYHIYRACLVNNNKVNKITIPPQVQSIGWRSFAYCPALKEIEYNAINAIKLYEKISSKYYSEAFSQTGEKAIGGITINIGPSCRTIGYGMFAPDIQHNLGTQFMRVRRVFFNYYENKKENMITISQHAFSYLAKMLEVYLPQYCILEKNSFSDCYSLMSANIYNLSLNNLTDSKKEEIKQAFQIQARHFNLEDIGNNFNSSTKIETSVDDYGWEMYALENGKYKTKKHFLLNLLPASKTPTTLPEWNENRTSYTIISYALFKNPILKSLELKNRTGLNAYITTENFAFSCCAIENLIIKEGYITGTPGQRLFEKCTNLISVDLSESTIGEGKGKEISAGMFAHCSNLAIVSLPKKLNGFGTDAFINCNLLLELNIPSTVTYASGSSLRIGSNNNKAIFYLNRTKADGARMTIQPSTFNATWVDKIIVPQGEREFYTANDATNWVALSDLGLIQEAEI